MVDHGAHEEDEENESFEKGFRSIHVLPVRLREDLEEDEGVRRLIRARTGERGPNVRAGIRKRTILKAEKLGDE